MSFTYLNLQGKLEHVTATAEDIDRQLQRLLQANPRIIPVTGRAAALGDELVLDYAGFSEGVQFPGGTAEKQTLTAQLAQKGLTLEAYCQFTGSDEKKLREDMRPDALEAFRTQKAVEKIAQLENLTVTDEEMDAAIQRICADNHMSAEDLKPYFDNGFLTVVRQQMLRDKATEVVRRSAQITQ